VDGYTEVDQFSRGIMKFQIFKIFFRDVVACKPMKLSLKKCVTEN